VLRTGVHPAVIPGTAAWLVGWLLVPLSIYIFVSAFDDFLVDLLWLWRCLTGRLRPAAPPHSPAARPERPIVIAIPCWHEAAVIGEMLDHNLAALRYSNYRVLVGVYANDPDTLRQVNEAAKRHPKVRAVRLPHDGPTVKADCLNWISHALEDEERELGREFVCLVQHDAEDLIHPDELALFNSHLDETGFLQLPVLPLASPLRALTHGVYCDDFAESQGKDLLTRHRAGAFVPGCGVGTAVRRDVLRQLMDQGGHVFDPASLTEDYDLGLRLFRMGVTQLFLPLRTDRGGFVATREYFPKRWSAAVRQRSRWIAGNALQGWERHGWRGNWAMRWFLWRDRKGLWGNPISLLCNVLLAAGLWTWTLHVARGTPWVLASAVHVTTWLVPLLGLNFALMCVRLAVRMAASGRLYGPRFAVLVPLRFFWANFLNAAATLRACQTWASAKLRGRPLAWAKTSHDYPTRGALLSRKKPLSEVLEMMNLGPASFFEQALLRCPGTVLQSEFLVSEGLLGEDDALEALCLQHSLPRAPVDALDAPPRVRRTLPARVAERWRAVPFRIASGTLHVATATVPSDEMLADLQGFTLLKIRFYLISSREYDGLLQEAPRR